MSKKHRAYFDYKLIIVRRNKKKTALRGISVSGISLLTLAYVKTTPTSAEAKEIVKVPGGQITPYNKGI